MHYDLKSKAIASLYFLILSFLVYAVYGVNPIIFLSALAFFMLGIPSIFKVIFFFIKKIIKKVQK